MRDIRGDKNPKSRKTINRKAVSHIVWCNQPGNLSYVPKGFVIHHADLNPNNDNPDNLVIMRDRDHRIYHSSLLLMYRRQLNQQEVKPWVP